MRHAEIETPHMSGRAPDYEQVPGRVVDTSAAHRAVGSVGGAGRLAGLVGGSGRGGCLAANGERAVGAARPERLALGRVQVLTAQHSSRLYTGGPAQHTVLNIAA